MNMKMYRSLFDTFRHALLHNPDGSREDAWRQFLDEVKDDPVRIEALARDYFDRNFAQYHVTRVGQSVTLAGTTPAVKRAVASAERRAEREQLKQKAVRKVRTAIVKQILTLDFIMPNEKRLRDCTGAEVVKFGGIFTEISRHVKPTQVVGHHLNAKQIESICSRYETKRKAA